MDLEDFIRNKMKMSHIYQPVMLKVLLESGGEATVEDIASALLSHDLTQVEYYSLRVKQMVGKVLTDNEVVQPIKKGNRIAGYKLKDGAISAPGTAQLIALCNGKIDAFLSKRGESLWQHRVSASGYVSGSVRYNVLKEQSTVVNSAVGTRARSHCMWTISFHVQKVAWMILATSKHFVRHAIPINVQKTILTLGVSSTATNIEIQSVFFVMIARVA